MRYVFLQFFGGLALIFLGIIIINYFGQFEKPVKLLGLAGFALILWGGLKAVIQLFVLIIAFIAKKTEHDDLRKIEASPLEFRKTSKLFKWLFFLTV